MGKCYLRQLEFWVCAIIVENRIENCLLRTHGVHCLFSFVMENCCLKQLEFWACKKLPSAHLMHCCVTSRWKILAWGRYNFELVQMFLKNQIGDCFVMHVLCSLCVFFRDGKFLVEALPGGMLRFCNYSWKLDWSLFCFARMVWTLCFSFVIENSCFRHVGI